MANKLVTYLKESRDELRRVVWPTRQETIRNTLLVIGVSLGVALFLGLIDFLLNAILQRVIS
ncbi:MAG: preprotein translocase subunit SecE [bacterium]